MKAPVDQPFNVTDTLGKYPKILDYGRQHAGARCFIFEKHDGSNLAWRWDGAGFGPATLRSGRSVAFEKWAMMDGVGVHLPADLFERFNEAIALHDGGPEAVLFTEFRGEMSFSGEHVEDDPKTLHPIDLWIQGEGFMPPGDFAHFFNVPILYQGPLAADVVEAVRTRTGRFAKVNEGVVCKGGDWSSYWSCKIKTRAWLARGGEP